VAGYDTITKRASTNLSRKLVLAVAGLRRLDAQATRHSVACWSFLPNSPATNGFAMQS
jgi:hypothetical protein